MGYISGVSIYDSDDESPLGCHRKPSEYVALEIASLHHDVRPMNGGIQLALEHVAARSTTFAFLDGGDYLLR